LVSAYLARAKINDRKPAYEQAVKRVRQALDVLAPEIFEAPPLPVSAPAGDWIYWIFKSLPPPRFRASSWPRRKCRP